MQLQVTQHSDTQVQIRMVGDNGIHVGTLTIDHDWYSKTNPPKGNEVLSGERFFMSFDGGGSDLHFKYEGE